LSVPLEILSTYHARQQSLEAPPGLDHLTHRPPSLFFTPPAGQDSFIVAPFNTPLPPLCPVVLSTLVDWHQYPQERGLSTLAQPQNYGIIHRRKIRLSATKQKESCLFCKCSITRFGCYGTKRVCRHELFRISYFPFSYSFSFWVWLCVKCGNPRWPCECGRLARLKNGRKARGGVAFPKCIRGRRRNQYPKHGSGNGWTVLVDLLFVFVSYSGYGWK